MESIYKGIERLKAGMMKRQQADGRLSFCFECGPVIDAYMIFLLKWMGETDPRIIHPLAERIRFRGMGDGIWKLYPDEKDGNLSTTVEACLALLYAGVETVKSSEMKRAREFIRERMNHSELGILTKLALTLLGHRSWTKQPKIPVEFFLLPHWAPIQFFDLVGYVRVLLAPTMILADRRFTIHLPGKEEISSWLPLRTRSDRGPIWSKEELIRLFHHLPLIGPWFQRQARQWGERFMLQRLEPDGTLYGFFISTFLMIFALLTLGYSKDHPVIQKAMHGVKSFLFPLANGVHMQATTSTVWDTSLGLYALQEAGVEANHPVIRSGVHYLLERQQSKWADWSIQNPEVEPGGWGFSDVNTINPDVDDTGACLRAISPTVRYQANWNRGVNWVLSMQNRDGGWGAFEKNMDAWWLPYLPYKDSRYLLGDPSTADLTGRMLEWIGHDLKWKMGHPVVDRAVDWLLQHQERDGSWFGRWGITYLYGTWAALTGLAAVGMPRTHPAVERANNWVKSIQNEDGGWGESCRSDSEKRYIPLQASTPPQTAWALDALIAYHDRSTPQIEAGIACLLRLIEKNTWETDYPTGQALAGQVYIRYHSYRYIWPLVTLAHYEKKYGQESLRT